MRARFIKGFPVVNLQDGSMLGRVQDLIVDPVKKKVEGLLVGERGFLKGRVQVIPFEQVNSIGKDAVTVENGDVLAPVENYPPLKAIKDYSFLGNNIISNEGNYIARAQDFTFSTKTGQIENILLYDIRVRDRSDQDLYLDIEAVISLGKDYIIAESAYAAYLTKIDREETSADYPETDYTLEMHAVEFVYNNEAAFTVRDSSGNVIIEKGQPVTPEIIEQARSAERLYQVLFAAGAGELLETVDYAAEKLDQGSSRLLEAWEKFKQKQGHAPGETEETEQAETDTETEAEQSERVEEIRHHAGGAFESLKRTWSRIEKELVNEGRELAHDTLQKMKKYAVGKKANYTVKDSQGHILVRPGDVITEEMAELAEAQERIVPLFFSAVSQEVEEAINNIGERINKIFH